MLWDNVLYRGMIRKIKPIDFITNETMNFHHYYHCDKCWWSVFPHHVPKRCPVCGGHMSPWSKTVGGGYQPIKKAVNPKDPPASFNPKPPPEAVGGKSPASFAGEIIRGESSGKGRKCMKQANMYLERGCNHGHCESLQDCCKT